MIKKYYAVKKGWNTGIYTTWDEAKKQVENYSNAVYKSFSTLKQAKDFLNDNDQKPLKNFNDDKNSCIAYTDGSYDTLNNTFSYGVVVFWKNREFHLSQRFNDSQLANLRNVAGEIIAVKQTIMFCLANKISKVIICHDYQGVSKWALNQWKANLDFTKEYKDFFNKYKDQISVEFKWIKSHTNNKYNDLADKLAKQATLEFVFKEV
ncbi:ribonuclease H1 domain-containing protein [Mycoplasma capricolum]|uniref:Ribonuclease H n=2 Tax=Mycoplasma capricolum subsp. capricolum TaxID=40479 RepID=Q2SSF9_MYCCT|nr:ribonuclease H family protein [Mycoplasma capricolum]ABC01405.1 ribonuclease H1, putative [Mycoplasma capricolum subsp. capricolum ATCC 27343]KEZ20991.1 Ribonuclease H-related protein [Mycoplasma capricolum subsp. capricolum 14232]